MTAAPLIVDIASDGSLSIDGVTLSSDAIRQMVGDRAVNLRGRTDIQFAQVQAAMIELQGLNLPIAIVGEG